MAQDREKIIYEYCILRYVPDIERGEFINIGLMMMSKRQKWIRTAVNIDENRILMFTGNKNLELLIKQSGVFTRTDVPRADLPVEERYRWMAAVKSAIIQTSPSHPGIIIHDGSDAKDLLNSKFDELFDRLVM